MRLNKNRVPYFGTATMGVLSVIVSLVMNLNQLSSTIGVGALLALTLVSNKTVRRILCSFFTS